MKKIPELRAFFDAALKKEMNALVQKDPLNLYEPIVYCLGLGGKRLRPILLLSAFQLYRADIERALPAALAIEIFHNFTLLHDDMMDQSTLRRNKPTVHIQFSDNAALLSGDAMSILASRYISGIDLPDPLPVLQHFFDTALQVCEGQQFDMDFETKTGVSVDQYLKMIGLKTAVLIASSLKLGALLAEAPFDEAENLYRFGYHLGLAFQLQDDHLDTFGDQESFGKKIGNDILTNKKTYLLLKALELAPEKEFLELTYWLNQKEFDPDEKISAIQKVYQKLSIASFSNQLIEEQFSLAKEHWNNISRNNQGKNELWQMAEKMMNRKN